MLSEPVTDPQCPAVSTQSGAIRVPLQPNPPPIRTSATYRNEPGLAGLPPTTAGAGVHQSANAHTAVNRTRIARMDR